MAYYRLQELLDLCKGNNAFSFEKRRELLGVAQLVIPKFISGSFADVELGDAIVFEEMDDGRIISAKGLQEYVEIPLLEKRVFVVDNHNHAFYCWAKAKKDLDIPALPLLHVDQHTDMRVPEMMFGGDLTNLSEVAVYTNEVLNVGNFIVPAQRAGLISEIHILDKENQFRVLEEPRSDFILDVDLDMFAPELSFMDQDMILERVRMLYEKARVVTFATSPFFIDQKLALRWMQKIIQ